MKLNSFNKYVLVLLVFIIAASCYSVVVFAKINDDVVDMEDLTKLTTTQNNTHEDKTVVPGSRGDVNKDGRIDIRDLVMLKKRLAKYMDITVVEQACDIDGDGAVAVRDAVLLSKHLAGIHINWGDEQEETKYPEIESTSIITATTPIQSTSIEQQTSTAHPDPDGPGWSDWIKP